MCGIGGFRRFGDTPIEAIQVKTMLCSLEERGNDATGVALQDAAGKIRVFKNNVPAWNMVSDKDFCNFLGEHLPEAQIALCHTRLATKGSPRDQENNHPLYTDNCAIVHNGCISNDDELFKEGKYPRYAEVDSDIIRAIADHEGLTQEGIRALTKIRGSVASAIISEKAPGKLLLVRSESPLIVGATEDMMMWASTKSALHLAARQWSLRFNMYMRANATDLVFLPVPNHSAWLFGPEGREWYQEFRTAQYKRVEPNYAVHDTYPYRQHKWDKKDEPKGGVIVVPGDAAVDYRPKQVAYPDFVICKNPDCGRTIEITSSLMSHPLHKLRCRACKTPLDTEPKGN